MIINRIFGWPHFGRQRRLVAKREAYSKTEFIDFFRERGVKEAIADATWTALVQAAVVSDFKPLPDDNLLEVFGLADDDLDEDIVLQLLQDTSAAIPTPAELSVLPPIETVSDLVQLIARQSAAGRHPGGAV